MVNKKYVLKVITKHNIYSERDDDSSVLHQFAQTVIKNGYYMNSYEEITNYVPVNEIISIYIMSHEVEKQKHKEAEEIAKRSASKQNSGIIKPEDKIVI